MYFSWLLPSPQRLQMLRFYWKNLSRDVLLNQTRFPHHNTFPILLSPQRTWANLCHSFCLHLYFTCLPLTCPNTLSFLHPITLLLPLSTSISTSSSSSAPVQNQSLSPALTHSSSAAELPSHAISFASSSSASLQKSGSTIVSSSQPPPSSLVLRIHPHNSHPMQTHGKSDIAKPR